MAQTIQSRNDGGVQPARAMSVSTMFPREPVGESCVAPERSSGSPDGPTHPETGLPRQSSTSSWRPTRFPKCRGNGPPVALATSRARASSRMATESGDSMASAKTSVSPIPRSVTRRIAAVLSGTRIVSQSSFVGSGTSVPPRRPVANSSTTAGGTSTVSAKDGSTWSKPIWCKYWRGEVSQMYSGKRRLPCHVLTSYIERIDSVLAQFH